MMKNYLVSGCIVTYNNADKLKNTVDSVLQNTKCDFRLYISDNGSSDGSLAEFKNGYNIEILENAENLGFGKAHNKVIPLLESEYHVVINPDIVLDRDVISELCNYLDENPDVVMVTPKILFPDGKEQILPKRIPTFRYLLSRRLPFLKKLQNEYVMADHSYDAPFDIQSCTGCFFVIRTSVFKKLNGFDERFFMYFEDCDLSIRAGKYGRIVFYPFTYAIHAWERASAKSIRFLLIHILSMIKFFLKRKS